MTNAHFLKIATFHLTDQPEIMRKLKAELKEAIPSPNEIPPLPELERLPYMHTIIQECYRLSYGVAHMTQRIVPNEDLVFRDWVIPAGTPCSMTSVLVHEDLEIFSDPIEFRPDR